MEPRQLAAFAAAAQEGNFSRAAERLGVVQPAVSQAVRRLEDELGLVLFERTSRRVTLTAAGEAFLPHARAALDALDAAREAAGRLATGREGALRVATTAGMTRLLHDVLAAFRAEHPNVRVDLHRSRGAPKLKAVVDGEVDVAFVRSAPATPGVRFTEVAADRWRVVVARDHPLRQRPPEREDAVPMKTLAPYPLLLVGRSDRVPLRDEFIRMCHAAGFEPTIGAVLANMEDALAAIGTSRGWTLLATRADSALDAAATAELPLTDELPLARIWAAARAVPTPPARAFVALARRLHVTRAGSASRPRA